MNRIRCLFKEPFKDPVVVEVKDYFRAIQKQLGCDCFSVVACMAGVAYYIDDDGKLKTGATPNLRYGSDIIVGNILAVGVRNDESIDLTDAQISTLTRCMKRDAFTPEESAKIHVKSYTGFTFIPLGGDEPCR